MRYLASVIAMGIAALGLGGMCWHHHLTAQQKQAVDDKIIQLSWEIYKKLVDELTKPELAQVVSMARHSLGY